MSIDNSRVISSFVPLIDDGEHFIYTEMLDRSKTKGNNGVRLMKTFYHRSQAEFWEQLPTIQKICDLSKVRACTRLSTRSFKRVGATFTKLVVDASLSENWAGMKTLYNKALGTTSSESKVWIWDIDKVDERTEKFLTFLTTVVNVNCEPVFLGSTPSKKGFHYLTRPFDARIASEFMQDHLGMDGGLRPNGDVISLHKDNPTNLYIPDDAT